MSTIQHTVELGPAIKQVYSPFEAYWNAFQEWRKRQKVRSQLHSLTNSELADIGISRGEIDYVASHRDADPRSVRSAW